MSRPRTSSYKASSASNFYTRKLHLRRPKLPVDAISWRIRPGLSHGSCHVNILWAPLKMRPWAASQSTQIRPLSTTRPIGRKTKGTASLPLHKPMHCFTYARLEYMQAEHVFLGLLLILYLLSSPVSSRYHGKDVWVESRCWWLDEWY